MSRFDRYYFKRLPHIHNEYEELTVALVLELLADAYKNDNKLERYLNDISEETFKECIKELKKLEKDGVLVPQEKIKLYNHPKVYMALKEIEEKEWRRFTEYFWIACNVIKENMIDTYQKTYQQIGEIYHFPAINPDFPPVQITDTYITEHYIEIPWCSDGKIYSERMYANVANFRDKLSYVLEQGIEKGKGYDWMVQAWRKLTGSTAYATARLIKTEMMAMFSEASKERMITEGVEFVEIVGDAECGGICLDYVDGDPIPIREASVGIDLPPYHPNCACSFVAYTEEVEISEVEDFDE